MLLIHVSIVADYQFTLYSASTLAACSIAAALRGLTLDGHLARLQELTRTDLVSYHLLSCLLSYLIKGPQAVLTR